MNQHLENTVKQFIIDTLELKELPEGSLHDILKDGRLLCDLISRFSPYEHININEGKALYACQDNIGQFLRVAENYLPTSDLFQASDLLNGKHMQSVISCLLAMKRVMHAKKIMPVKTRPTTIKDWQAKFSPDHKRHLPPIPNGGFVKTRVQMISLNETPIKTRRFSSEAYAELMPTPSKSTPNVVDEENKKKLKYYQSMEQANRKTSLKKMGTCAIKVKNEDGTLDIYALGKSIGKGQFGEVFGGLNMDTGEYVAIKRIKINQMDCDDMNEVGVLQHLDSEYIVRYKGFSKDKEYLNIILEYVEMGSLLNNIRAFGKFPEKLAASYTFKILSGLHYLHSKDVVHCDLKAANILTTKTGGLKLTDFGVSLSLKMKEDEDTGEPAGTPNWMAPEVIKFAGASDKADIWSLGCTIVEMLTGKPPYAGVPSFTALYRIVEDEEPPIPKKIKLSKDANEFLLACFKKNPEDRPSAYELMQFKWMAPYFNKERPHLLSDQSGLKKSKSETCIEMRNEMAGRTTRHEFVDYQTLKSGEKCYACSYRMKDLWVKQCQDCLLKFHPHCVNKAPKCTKQKYMTTKEKVNVKHTPLGPLHDDYKHARKFYLVPPTSADRTASQPNQYETRRNISSIMT